MKLNVATVFITCIIAFISAETISTSFRSIPNASKQLADGAADPASTRFLATQVVEEGDSPVEDEDSPDEEEAASGLKTLDATEVIYVMMATLAAAALIILGIVWYRQNAIISIMEKDEEERTRQLRY